MRQLWLTASALVPLLCVACKSAPGPGASGVDADVPSDAALDANDSTVVTVWGIDVSHHQTVDWPSLAQSQLTFAFAKATEYVDFVDPKYAANQDGMAGIGVVRGAYHFLMHTNGAAQADWFVQHVDTTSPLMLAVDFESATWGTGSATIADLEAFVTRFHQLLPDHTLLLYTSIGHWHGLGNPPQPSGTVLWNANWAGLPIPDDDSRWTGGYGGWTHAPIVQYGPTKISGQTFDGDAYRGTLADLNQLAH